MTVREWWWNCSPMSWRGVVIRWPKDYQQTILLVTFFNKIERTQLYVLLAMFYRFNTKTVAWVFALFCLDVGVKVILCTWMKNSNGIWFFKSWPSSMRDLSKLCRGVNSQQSCMCKEKFKLSTSTEWNKGASFTTSLRQMHIPSPAWAVNNHPRCLLRLWEWETNCIYWVTFTWVTFFLSLRSSFAAFYF